MRTDFRHQYGIFGGESQMSFTRNSTRAGSEEGRLFSQAIQRVVLNKIKNPTKCEVLQTSQETLPFFWLVSFNPKFCTHFNFFGLVLAKSALDKNFLVEIYNFYYINLSSGTASLRVCCWLLSSVALIRINFFKVLICFLSRTLTCSFVCHL